MTVDQRNICLLALLSALLFLPFLGNVHLFDWDEINFAEISREMILSGNYLTPQINFEAFYEKPPLFFWFQSLTMHGFGINEYAARLPNAICAIITIPLLYIIGKRLFDRRFALLWAFAYLGSVLPNFYFRSGIIDPVFNLFIFLSLIFFIQSRRPFDEGIETGNRRWANAYLIWSGLLLGLAILTKGPVAYLIILLSILSYSVIRRSFQWHDLVKLSIIAFVLPLSWLLIETLQNGTDFIENFWHYHLDLLLSPVAGHKGFFGFHILILILGCFPASIFCIRCFFKGIHPESSMQKEMIFWMKVLLWVVLILFTLVQSKIIHYSSLGYFPISFLAALCIKSILDGKINFNRWLKVGVYFIGLCFLLASFLIVYFGMHLDLVRNFVKDPFVLSTLDAQFDWNAYLVLPGIILILTWIQFELFMKRNQLFLAFCNFLLGIAIFVFVSSLLIVPRIEKYSQAAAIEFYKSKVEEDCYIDTWGFKSYAQFFYSRKTIPKNDQHADKTWLLNGDIDKVVYFVVKVPRDEIFQKNFPHFKELYRKNGFVFYKRNTDKSFQ